MNGLMQTSSEFIKTCFMQFQSKNICTTAVHINYKNKIVSNNTNLKFLGLLIDNALSWK
jgi:dsRNA-specific ribonuclease